MQIAPPEGQMGGPPPPPIKHNFKVKTKDNDDDDESNDSFDVWAALEEACAELGWSLQQIKEMLEDTANFPPQEILKLIMASTGCDDAGKIIKMLAPQRAAVLEKVKFSIKENQRLKSAEEAKVQKALAGMLNYNMCDYRIV
jgi:DNA-binding transcriptional MerR regulator